MQLAEIVTEHDIGLVIDIHGSHAFRPHDVDVGTLHQQAWLGKAEWRQSLFTELRDAGFLATDNTVFSGEGSTPQAQTIVAFCRESGVRSVQLEISSVYLTDMETRIAQHMRAKLVYGLVRFIDRAFETLPF